MLETFALQNEMDERNRKIFIDKIGKHAFVKHRVLSKSFCGRDIDYLQIGKIDDAVLLLGATHGMEWLTISLLLCFFDFICHSYESRERLFGVDLHSFFLKTGLVVVPCLNPDGVEIHLHGAKAAKGYSDLVKNASEGNTSFWQANARGVDLNHNFDAGWKTLRKQEIDAGILKPAPTRYGGSFPFSEVESHSLMEFCQKKNFRHAVSFHSQGQEIYWHYGKKTPNRAKHMADIFEAASGYKAASPEGLAVGGGFKDWFIEAFCKPAFTVEIGKGKNPLPIEDLLQIYKDLKNMMILALII